MTGPHLALLAGIAVPALVILALGTRLAAAVEGLGRRLGIGDTLAGAVVLGATTSLSGIVISVTAAYDGHATLAASNAVGGIALQTAFLVVGDLAYRRANLEHDAATAANLVQTALLLLLLALVLCAMLLPSGAELSVHPVSLLLFAVYVVGLRHVRSIERAPTWTPRGESRPGDGGGSAVPGAGTARLVLATLFCAAGVAAAGVWLTRSADAAAAVLGLDDAAIGALGTGAISSLPELVTTVTAVRRGALSIALGGIMGGNAFDVLFLAAADLAYAEGSLYHAAGRTLPFQLALTVLMVTILLLGLLLRERRGPANIGFESMAVLGVYGLYGALLVAGVA